MILSEHSLESMEAASNGPRVLRVESQVFCPRDDRSFPPPPNQKATLVALPVYHFTTFEPSRDIFCDSLKCLFKGK